MESGGSFRIGSSSIWRDSDAKIFSNSYHRENDEEALKWATIQKLPTVVRLRKGLLTSPEGEVNEIDVQKLGFQERRTLLDRLVRTVEDDNEKFLLKLKERVDRVGIDLPTIEVRFENLNIAAEACVGTRPLPTFTNFTVNIVQGLLNSLLTLPSRRQQINILQDVSGIIKPGRMALLLGPPSSGKTTLLLALAAKLDPKLKFSGKVTYNGHGMNEFVPQRTAAYVNQNDLHIAELTARETLAFSARVQGVGTRYDLLAELSRREKEANIKPDPDIDIYMKAVTTGVQKANLITDYVLRILGLEVCADTIVGNAMLRGISGGQKKRLTTGEMLVGPVKALFMDEISTGLDSSTTFQIVNSLKQYVHILKGTAVISLLQPAPETYNLFDDIIVLSDSHIGYQGPREYVLEFFESMGFKCPERKGVADFLQEVTSWKDQEQYWADKDQPYRFVTSKEFSEAHRSFHVGRSLGEELATEFDKSKSHPAALTTKRYGVGKWELLKACLSREYLLMKRNSFYYTFKLSKLAVMAFITMTIFLRTEMHRDSVTDGGIYVGAMFYGIVTVMFNGLAEISVIVSRLPVFYKQRDNIFFPSWAYALPEWILKIPMSFAEVGVWVFLTYYVIGFDPYIERFFRQYLVLVLLNQMTSALFRFIAALGREPTVATTLAWLTLAILYSISGFVLSKGIENTNNPSPSPIMFWTNNAPSFIPLMPTDKIKKWWLWGFWISPMMYGQNAMVNNEFLGKRWRHILPDSTEPLGVEVLKSWGFFTQSHWYWIGVGALIGYTLLFNFGYILALMYLSPPGKHQAVISEEAQSNDQNGVRKFGSASGSTSSHTLPARGIVLPFQPHSITFDEVTYDVDMPQEMRKRGVVEDKLVILKGVSGAFRPGVLTALMGITGAGKTTLLDVLAGRKTGGYVGGNITISGYQKKQETFPRISGYCEQNDIHSPHVTVYESLLYSAWLRLSPDINTETKRMFIEEVMELVELKPLRHALVGLPGVNGLSTEQRKRLTIAVELVANPSIIFMDEPTSGLDARAAAIVMRTVRNTVDTGRTVVCTIHQPSIDIFESFDELLLMKQGGQQIYVGPLGQYSSNLISYFEGIQGVNKIKDGYNPATWMLEVTTSAKEIELGIDFADVYKNSEHYRRNKALVKELSSPAPGSVDLYFPSQYSTSFITQCIACLWKQHWSYWHNSQYTTVSFLYSTTVAILFGSMFWNLGSKIEKQKDLFNAMGSMYASVLLIGIQNAYAVQPSISVERIVFYRETAAGMYSALPYALAQATVKLCLGDLLVMGSNPETASLHMQGGSDPKPTHFLYGFLWIQFTMEYLLRIHSPTAREANEIDVQELGLQEKRALLERLVKTAEENNEKFLLKLKGRIDRVGIDLPTIEVWLENLNIEAEARVGTRALPTFTNFMVNIEEFLPNSTEPLGVEILKSRGFFTQSYWYWIGVGALIGYTLLFNFGYILLLTYLNPLEKHQSVISEKLQSNEQVKRNFSHNSNRERNDESISGSTSPETNHNRTRGMVLPLEPHFITFDDVTYSVDMPVEMRNRGVVEDKLVVLKGVSGAFRPGVLTALMGVTGAGKTTLMDVLAGRKTGGYIGGNITISGYPKKQETFARISGYCEQNDMHSPHVTVYESLLYSAWLRLSPEINAQTRKMFIEEVMELVELKPLRHALVGLPGINGLSTEQRKRLTIAVELVANPSIIFMDEPTSGLDARAAAIVMRTVRNTVDTGRTVVCTIHQPSIDIFESFDELLLMKQGGQEIYVGPLGHHSSHLISYFEGIKGVNRIKDGYNPATWMLEVSTSAKEMELGVDFAEVYKISELYRRNKALIKELSTAAPGSKDLYFPSQYSTSYQ
ncbi:Pleiotropic drug resistance protein 1 [Glycine soja]